MVHVTSAYIMYPIFKGPTGAPYASSVSEIEYR